jgi:hypothetical protein
MTLHHGKRPHRAIFARSCLHMLNDRPPCLEPAQQFGGHGSGKVAWRTRIIMAIDANGKSRK